MQHLTVRNIPEAVALALKAERHRRCQSLNQTVIQLLSQSLGVGPESKRSNGLSKLAGTWSREEHERITAAISATDQIDDELWQ